MVPFNEPGPVEVLQIEEGSFTARDTVAQVRDSARR